MTIVEEGVSSVYAAPGQRGALADYRARYAQWRRDPALRDAHARAS